MEKIYQINDQFEIEVLIETNDRFESIRQICVKDPKNRLADNYQPNRLVVEEHDLFMVIWDRTNKEPVSFSGIYNGEGTRVTWLVLPTAAMFFPTIEPSPMPGPPDPGFTP